MTRLLRTSRGEVAIRTLGRGGEAARPALYVHGNSLDGSLFEGAPGGWALDFPGHGSSPRPEGTEAYSIEAFAEILVEVSADLFGEGPAFLVCHSLGGHVALQAMARGFRPAGLVCVGTPPLAGLGSLGRAFRPSPGFSALLSGSLSPDEAGLAAESLTLDRGPLLERLAALLLARDERFVPTFFGGLDEDSVRDEVAALRRAHAEGTRYLGLLGERDALVDRGYWEESHAGLAHELLPGLGHCPQAEAPAAFHARVEAFAAALRP